MKRCLIIYIGNGYAEKTSNYYNDYQYSIDMRDNLYNHHENIYEPIRKLGYKMDTCLITNKHKKYSEFVKYYYAIDIPYNDITSRDEDILYNYYALRVPRQFGPGVLKSGARILKARDHIPQDYDLYVFVRADANFKIPISDLKIDYTRMNWLWKETDYRFFNEQRENFLATHGTEFVFWNHYWRVSGNVINIVPRKYFKIFTSYYWSEHMALFMMINDLSPLISYENDVNLMCGEDKCYVTDANNFENPVFNFNKKILKPEIFHDI